MANPKLVFTFSDGQVGVRPLSPGDVVCVMGCCSSGTINVPVTYGGNQQAKIVTEQGYGPAVQLAALLSSYGFNLIFIKLTSTTAGSQGAVTFTGTGTSVVTTTGTSRDDYLVRFLVVAGGTIGVSGITFKYSYDDGVTYSQVIALGTANTYVLPNTGITLNFGAGTLVAADLAKFTAVAPKWSATDVTAGNTALLNSQYSPDLVFLAGNCSATEAATVKTAIATAQSQYRYPVWLVEAARQTAAQSEAVWIAAIQTDYASFSSIWMSVAAGLDKIPSPVDGFSYMRPAMWAAALRCLTGDAGIDLARVLDGPVIGSLWDSGGNLVAHDERVTPGLDDSRFLTLTSIPGEQGPFITNPKTMAPSGSDYDLLQFPRIIAKAATTIYAVMRKQLSNGVRVKATNGTILEKDALALEAIGNTALNDAITGKNRASRAYLTISRTDNILSTRTVNGKVRIVSLAYIKEFDIEFAFENPAIKVL